MKKIAYFHIFGGPPIEHSVRNLLVTTFPEYEVRSIVLMPLLRRHPLIVAWNCLIMLKQYGFAVLRGRRSIKSSFLATTFLFAKVKQLARSEIIGDKSDYAFTFQLQSLFDTSVAGIPNFVYTDHTHLENLKYPGYDKRRLNSAKWIKLEKSIYANATTVFTRSSNISKSLEQDYNCPRDKIACVYVGTNTEISAADPDNEDYANKNILFVGGDWARKGGPVLLQAFSLLLKSHPDATLTIIGCTPATDLPNCRVVGRLPIAEVSRYYSSASVFCLPTLHEPFGVVFVEAMSHKLPVVATNVGAVPDLVIDQVSGILVPPNDESALAAALDDMLANPAKAKALGYEGFSLAKERFNWQSVGKAIRQEVKKQIG